MLAPGAWALLKEVGAGTPLPTEAADEPYVRLDAIHESLPVEPRPLPSLTADNVAALRAYIPGAIFSRLTAAGPRG